MEDELDTGPLAQVAGGSDAVHEGLGDVGDVGLSGLTAANIDQYYAQMAGTQKSQKELIEQATQALRNQRAPSLWGSLGEGLSQVKRQPGIAGTLANISSGLNAYDKRKSAFDEARAERELEYKLKQLELQGKMGQTGLDRATRLAQLEAAQAKASAPSFSLDPLGRGVVRMNRTTGETELIPTKGAPEMSSTPNIVVKDGVRFLVENAGTPKQNFTRLPDAPLSAEEAANKAADVTEARILAKDAATAKTLLPKARSSAERALKGIDDMLNHPGLSAVVGLPDPTRGGLGFVQIPGTPAANFQARLDQLKGGAFLEAYNTLKGGGQISNIEGAKAEAAIVRASAAQTEVEFRQAMNDFADAIRAGLANLETSASGAAFDIGRAPPAASPRAAPAAAPNANAAALQRALAQRAKLLAAAGRQQ
jgi:hypothetical protein